MKKKKLFKRIAALALSAMMVLGMTSMVGAAPTIDTTEDVSLTIIKRSSVDADGDNIKEPISGVTFNYAKIGNIGQVTVTEGNQVKNITGYTLAAAIETILTSNGALTHIAESNGVKYYDGGAIQDALTTALTTKKQRLLLLPQQLLEQQMQTVVQQKLLVLTRAYIF